MTDLISLPTEILVRITYFLKGKNLINFLICSPDLQLLFEEDEYDDSRNYITATGFNGNNIMISIENIDETLIGNIISNGIKIRKMILVDKIDVSILSSIDTLESITSFYYVPQDLNECKSLVSLSLLNIAANDIDLGKLQKLSQLECLHIKVTKTINQLIIRDEFDNLINLNELKFIGVTMEHNTIFKTLTKLTKLKIYGDMDNSNITFDLPHLQKLYIFNRNFSRFPICGIENCVGLTHLELNGYVNDRALMRIAKLTNLVSLDIGFDTKIKSVDCLRSLTNLKRICIVSSTTESFDLEFLQSPHLVFLEVFFKISPNSFKSFDFNQFHYLQWISIKVMEPFVRRKMIDLDKQCQSVQSTGSRFDSDLKSPNEMIKNKFLNSFAYKVIKTNTLDKLMELFDYHNAIIKSIIDGNGKKRELIWITKKQYNGTVLIELTVNQSDISITITTECVYGSINIKCCNIHPVEYITKTSNVKVTNTLKYSNDELTEILKINYLEYLKDNGYSLIGFSSDLTTDFDSEYSEEYDFISHSHDCSLWLNDFSVIRITHSEIALKASAAIPLY